MWLYFFEFGEKHREKMSTFTKTLEISSLEQQLEKAKTNLKGLNSEIRRIVGRPIEEER